MTITGTNLQNASAVDFGTTVASSFTSDAAGQIVLTSPAHTPGTVDVTVVSRGGTSHTSASDEYTYVTCHRHLRQGCGKRGERQIGQRDGDREREQR